MAFSNSEALAPLFMSLYWNLVFFLDNWTVMLSYTSLVFFIHNAGDTNSQHVKGLNTPRLASVSS